MNNSGNMTLAETLNDRELARIPDLTGSAKTAYDVPNVVRLLDKRSNIEHG